MDMTLLDQHCLNTVRGGWMDRSEMATWLGAGLLLAAVLASAIGLLETVLGQVLPFASTPLKLPRNPTQRSF